MPEGDTIYRTALNLRRALDGQEVTGGPARLHGQTVAEVESRGKHLLIWFAPSGLALHSHMMMSGSWHLYRPGERWGRHASSARVVLETADWVAVCFSAPVCEVLTGDDVRRHRSLSVLGPDAMAERTDLAEARRRLDSRSRLEIGEVLADQRVLAGVGNVYRCEVLCVCGVHPWTRVSDVEPGTRDALLSGAVRLMKANVKAVPRLTTGRTDQRLYVYGRAGRPCGRCGEPVRVDRQGQQARVTFWCGRCQPALRPSTGGADARSNTSRGDRRAFRARGATRAR